LVVYMIYTSLCIRYHSNIRDVNRGGHLGNVTSEAAAILDRNLTETGDVTLFPVGTPVKRNIRR
jgi:hypothetical protein